MRRYAAISALVLLIAMSFCAPIYAMAIGLAALTLWLVSKVRADWVDGPQPVLLLALVLLASPAQAETIRLWMGSAFDTEHSTFRDFTISTSPTAYISIAASEVGLKILRPSDGANVAALIADLTNGVANPVTWANGSFSYTVAENIGFGNVFSDPPVVGRSGDLNGIDFAGTSIERFELYRSNTGGIKGYGLSIYGHLPEPGLGAMLLTLCGCCAHFRMGPRSRSIGR